MHPKTRTNRGQAEQVNVAYMRVCTTSPKLLQYHWAEQEEEEVTHKNKEEKHVKEDEEQVQEGYRGELTSSPGA